jgi:uncharacterized protein (DUF1330 family)
LSAYVIDNTDIVDPASYEEYRRRAPATVHAFGGKYLARGGAMEILEGAWKPARIVVLEFPSLQRAKEWLDSPEYQAIRPIRQRYAKCDFVLVDGVDSQP